MSELQIHEDQQAMTIWEDTSKLAEIKEVFAPTLSNTEFQMFIGMGKATGLNPFLREMWAVKYGNSAAQIFIGRDGYRKAVQPHPEYEYHHVDAVYENDVFEVKNGEPNHSYNLKNRGKLLGAYCVAKRTRSKHPMYVFVEVNEYNTKKSVWADKPATMIKKVAEAQCLRACFQDIVGGTYLEDEYDVDKANRSKRTPAQSKEELMAKVRQNAAKTYEAEKVVNPEPEETGEVATPQQVKDIHKLMSEKEFQGERLQKALAHYGVETMGQLTKAQADDFIAKLNKV